MVSIGQRNTSIVICFEEVIAMGRERGRIFTAPECADLWRRYKAGESILGIARVLGRNDSSVYGVIRRRGGIAPAERHRSSRVLSLVEREEVSRGIAAGYTDRKSVV